MQALRSRHFKALGSAVVFSFAVPVMAFELLSEGAMDSVSAVSVEQAQDLINVAGATAAGLRIEEGYEQLPLGDDKGGGDGKGVQLEGYSVEDNSGELELTLSKEVEMWAESVREGASLGVTEFKVGFVDQLPPSFEQEYRPPTFDDAAVIDFDAFVISSDAETIYQVGRVDQTFALIDSGVDSISYNVKRFIEHTSTQGARPSDSREYMGSGYVTNLTSESYITIAGTRD